MDAYCDYLRQTAETKLTDLRREAAQERLARSLTATKKAERSWFSRRPRRTATAPMQAPVRVLRPTSVTDGELRRSA